MTDRAQEEIREDIAFTLAARVRGGFLERDEIWTEADDICEEAADPDAMRQYAAAELERLWIDQRKQEATWPDRTDCDRLDAAFKELDSTGVVCRQDFTCCGTCGAGEIRDECKDWEAAHGERVRGYAFYHMQDTEHAVEGHGVYRNYGARDERETAALEIGREIVAVLKSHGLHPDWDGTWGKRIHVPLQWRRRLTPKD